MNTILIILYITGLVASLALTIPMKKLHGQPTDTGEELIVYIMIFTSWIGLIIMLISHYITENTD